MNGVIVLQGGGPFVSNDSLDAEVLSGIDGYVAILPTADAFEANVPLVCDMAQLTGMEIDGKTFDQVKAIIDAGRSAGKWIIFAGHEMDEGGRQITSLSTLEELCKYAMDPANGIWIDNVHNIAAYVRAKRGDAAFSSLHPLQQSRTQKKVTEK